MLQAFLAKTNKHHPCVFLEVDFVTNIVCRTPEVCANFRSPHPRCSHAVFTQAIDHWTAGHKDRVMHLFIGELNLIWFINFSRAAPVVFKEVHSPVGVCFCILFFMSVAPRIASARFRSRRGVNPELEATTVNVVSYS